MAAASALFEIGGTVTNTTTGRNVTPNLVLAPAAIYVSGPDGCATPYGSQTTRTKDGEHCLVFVDHVIPSNYSYVGELGPDESVDLRPVNPDNWSRHLSIGGYSETDLATLLASGSQDPIALAVILAQPMYVTNTDDFFLSLDPASCMITAADDQQMYVIAVTPGFSCTDL